VFTDVPVVGIDAVVVNVTSDVTATAMVGGGAVAVVMGGVVVAGTNVVGGSAASVDGVDWICKT